MAKVVAKVVFDRIPEIQGLLRQRAGQIVAATAREIASDAKQRAPVRTGNLRRSIHAEQSGPFRWVVGTDVAYAEYVEFGTHRMAPRPYLIPAAEAARPRLEAELSNLL